MQSRLASALYIVYALQGATAHPAGHAEYHDRLHSSYARSPNIYTDTIGNTSPTAIRLADSLDENPYTMEFLSTATTPRTMIVWNKVGPDGANSGSFSVPAVNFTLLPGSSQIVTFEPNVQGGFCDFTEQKKTKNGQYDCPYGEFNIAPQLGDSSGSHANGGWSAADVSTYNQDPMPEGQQIGVGRPCNLNIGAVGVDGKWNSTCEGNYYWAAAGSFGLADDIGVVVPGVEEAHFLTRVGDMGVAS